MAILEIDEVERASETGITVLKVKGEIDLDTVGLLRSRLEEVTGRGDAHLVLDLAETGWVSSSALAVLVKFSKICDKAGGTLALACVNSRVRVVFEMLGLLPFFSFCDTVDEAREFLSQERGA